MPREEKPTALDPVTPLIQATSTLRSESVSSCEIKSGAKGEIIYTVKVYNEDPEVAVEDACRLFLSVPAKLGGGAQ